MKYLNRSFVLAAVVVAMLWLTPNSYAISVSLDNSVGNNPTWYGEFVAPYSANNGHLSIICDDIKDDQNIGSPYDYNVVNYNSITTGSNTNVMFGNLTNAGALYGEAAYLMIELFQNPSNAAKLTFAIWDVFDNAAVLAQMGGHSDNPDYMAVQALVADAESNYGSANLSSVSFLVPVGCEGVGLDKCYQNGQQVQEFGMVPEGGAALMYLLLAGVTCFGAIFYSRHQTAMGGLA